MGILTRNDLTAGLGRTGPGPVGEVMQRDFVTADPRDMLQTALPGCRSGTVRPCRWYKTAASWGW